MIIDFHTHTFPDKMALQTVNLLKSKSGTVPYSDGTVGGLSQRAADAGVDLSVVLPVITNPASTDKINEYAAKVCSDTANTHVLSLGGMHPDVEDYKSAIKRIYDLGLKGFKIHPAYQRTQINDIKFKRIIGYAQELGLIVITHGGLDIGVAGDWCSPRAAAELCDDVKPERLVIAHMGGWEMWQDVKKYLCGKPVYFDTSFSAVTFSYDASFPDELQKPTLPREDFIDIIKLHGANKILFGTDSPWGGQTEQLNFIKSLPLGDEEKDAILGNNAAALLNL